MARFIVHSSMHPAELTVEQTVAVGMLRQALGLSSAAFHATHGAEREIVRQDAADVERDANAQIWAATQTILFRWGLPNGHDALPGTARQDALSLPSEHFIDLAWKDVRRPESPFNLLAQTPQESIGSWAMDAVRARVLTRTGQAQLYSGGTDFAHSLGIDVEAFDIPIAAFITEGPASLYQIERYGTQGINLRAELDRTAPLAHDEMHNRLAAVGDASLGLQGYANLSGAQRHDSGLLMSTATGANLYTLMSFAVTQAAVQTRQAADAMGGRLFVSPEFYRAAAEAVYTTGDGMSALERFRATYPDVEITVAHECDDIANVTGLTAIVAIPRTPERGSPTFLRTPAFMVPVVQSPLYSRVYHISATAGLFSPIPEGVTIATISRS